MFHAWMWRNVLKQDLLEDRVRSWCRRILAKVNTSAVSLGLTCLKDDLVGEPCQALKSLGASLEENMPWP